LPVSVVGVLDSFPDLPGVYYGEDESRQIVVAAFEPVEFLFEDLGVEASLPVSSNVHVGDEVVGTIFFLPNYVGSRVALVWRGVVYCGFVAEGGIYFDDYDGSSSSSVSLSPPGAPLMNDACWGGLDSAITFFAPSEVGSGLVLEYELWVDNTPYLDWVQGVTQGYYPDVPPSDFNQQGQILIQIPEDVTGLDVTVRARNAVGWGPLAADVVGQFC
jgi:hypothetical protein